MPVFCRMRSSISCACWAGRPRTTARRCRARSLSTLFSLEGINRSNATINFTEEDPFDPKAVWLNAEHLRTLAVDELAERLLPFAQQAGFTNATPEKLRAITPLIRERIRLLSDVVTVADFFFAEPRSYDPAELIPQKGDAAMAAQALRKLEGSPGDRARLRLTHRLEAALRAAAAELKREDGTDVPAHPRGGVRAQECAAAFRNAGSAGARHRARPVIDFALGIV